MLTKCQEVRLSTVDALVGNSSGRRTIIRNSITSSSLRVTQGGQTILRERVTPNIKKRSTKGRIKSSTVAIYASIFTLLIAVIAVGYRAPEQATASTSTVTTATQTPEKAAVNEVVATNIAASIAQATDLAVAPNVAELAVATRVQSEYNNTSGDASTISKPAIVDVTDATRDVTTYTAQAGDTTATVAQKFGISENTVKWANNLTGSSIAVGSTLQILPRDGITYVVKAGDTIDTIAAKYKADPSLIVSANDLEISGLTSGLKIVIPNGELPETERPGYVAPRAYNYAQGTYITGYSAGFSSGKTWFIHRGTPNLGRYAYGNCTAYAFDRRLELGRPIGAMWGNAGSWATNARNAGYTVNRTPAAGAVIQDYGHVGIVEHVLPNGDLELSEMNARVSGGGFNIVSGRILPASQVGQYYYIH